MANALKSFRGSITITFADGTTNTWDDARAHIYEGGGGVLKLVDSGNVEHVFSPHFWWAVSSSEVEPGQSAVIV